MLSQSRSQPMANSSRMLKFQFKLNSHETAGSTLDLRTLKDKSQNCCHPATALPARYISTDGIRFARRQDTLFKSKHLLTDVSYSLLNIREVLHVDFPAKSPYFHRNISPHREEPHKASRVLNMDIKHVLRLVKPSRSKFVTTHWTSITSFRSYLRDLLPVLLCHEFV